MILFFRKASILEQNQRIENLRKIKLLIKENNAGQDRSTFNSNLKDVAKEVIIEEKDSFLDYKSRESIVHDTTNIKKSKLSSFVYLLSI